MFVLAWMPPKTQKKQSRTRETKFCRFEYCPADVTILAPFSQGADGSLNAVAHRSGANDTGVRLPTPPQYQFELPPGHHTVARRDATRNEVALGFFRDGFLGPSRLVFCLGILFHVGAAAFAGASASRSP